MNKNDNKALELASKLGNNVNEKKIKIMEEKLPYMKKGPIYKIWYKVVDIYNGFMSEQTPASLKALLIGSLLYLVLPFDVVPDFIPFGGLLDDVTVLTYVWTKLSKVMKLGAKISKPIIEETINNKVQDSIKVGYIKAFEYGQKKLEKVLKKKGRNILKNCIINLAFFIVAILFLSNNNKESAMISSIIILILVFRSVYSFFKSLGFIVSFTKIYIKEKNIDASIAIYLKKEYSFIASIENFKNKMKVFDDIPNLEELVKLQRKALLKVIIEVIITIIIAISLAFIFRKLLISKSDYDFIELIKLPFISLVSLF